MNIHEIITLIIFLGPLFYAWGGINASSGDGDRTDVLMVIVWIVSLVSAAVAITIRVLSQTGATNGVL
jgi:hypothetical protein